MEESSSCYRETTLGICLSEALEATNFEGKEKMKKSRILSEFDRAFTASFEYVLQLYKDDKIDVEKFIVDKSTDKAAAQEEKDRSILKGNVEVYGVCGTQTQVQLKDCLYTSQRAGVHRSEKLNIKVFRGSEKKSP